MAFNREQGYIAIEGFFDSEVAEIQAAFNNFVDESRIKSERDDVFGAESPNIEPSHAAENPKLRRLKEAPHPRHPVFEEAAKCDKILELIALLIDKRHSFLQRQVEQ